MRARTVGWFLLAAIGLGVLGVVWASADRRPPRDAPGDSMPRVATHVDHAPLVTGPFASGSEVTAACLICHPAAARDVMQTSHWTWAGHKVDRPGRTQELDVGKRNLLNNFCIHAGPNMEKCASCHAGYGWADNDFDFGVETNVDCLVCHDQTKTYQKGRRVSPRRELTWSRSHRVLGDRHARIVANVTSRAEEVVFACSAIGQLDFSRVWVPPIHLGPAIVGSLVRGIGFIIGGYCPGTSLVSLSTLKVDGAFFALGVFFGSMGFAATAPRLSSFWNQTGSYGRLTLFEWLGLDAGWVVGGVFLMALCAFAVAEWAERIFRRGPEGVSFTPQTRQRRRMAIAGGLALAWMTAWMGQPDVARRIAWQQEHLEQRLASREIFIDPAELLSLMHNNQIQLVMLDVRSEADFNLFHLLDAHRATLPELESDLPKTITPSAVVVTISNHERAAIEAWKRLAVRPHVNAYVLAGGINRWLDLYRMNRPDVPPPDVPAPGDDQLRHPFDAALGQTFTVSRPANGEQSKREFPQKVKVLKPVRSAGGGCG